MPTAEKVDLYKAKKTEYAATPKPSVVKIGPASYLSISGKGAPGGTAFSDAIGALYGVAFTVKMTRKFAGKRDYAVCKLEARYPNLSCASMPPKEEWTWDLMIRTPEFVTKKEVSTAIATLQKRGKGKEAERVTLDSLTEGLCVQALHVGPYDKEAETIASMQAFAESKRLKFAGIHHEVYLSDPRRVAPEKLKTILRIPVTNAG